MIYIFTLFFGCMFFQAYIENKSRVDIGVISTLSGDDAHLGKSVLNGIIMGAEEFNSNRNFYKKKMNLIIRDDKNDPLKAKQVAIELIDEGVVALLGPVLPDTGLSAREAANNRKKPMISTAVRAKKPSDNDDYFMGIAPSQDKNAKFIAEISKDYFNMKKVLFFYSDKNSAYMDAFRDKYIEEFEKKSESENTVYIKRKSDKIDTYFPSMKDDIDGVIIVADPIETAYIVQKIKKIKKDMKIFISDLAFHQNFITYGGKFSEGVYAALYYDDIYLDEKSSFLNQRFADFKKRYVKKFGKNPDMGSIYGYESFNILVEAIKRNKDGDSENLKKEILSPESDAYFLQPGSFDEYGNCERDIFIFQVKDQRFQKVKLL